MKKKAFFNQSFVALSLALAALISLSSCKNKSSSEASSVSSAVAASSSQAASSKEDSSEESSIIMTYTVTWEDEDGTVLETDNNVPYGTTPTYDGKTPTKNGTDQYSFSFSGWTAEVVPVTGNTEYTAKYTSTVNKYTVIWKNYDAMLLEKDENVEYGTTPTYDGATPTRPSTDQYSYTFDGWTTEVGPVTGNTSYLAKYSSSVRKYAVTWKNYDGTVLETDPEVDYGTKPVYGGATPVKTGSEKYSYTFSGWDKSITAVTGDVTYTAVFTYSINTYTVTWKNEDGTVLETDDNVEYGGWYEYDGDEPIKESTDEESFDFAGWDKDVYQYIKEDIVFTATYTSEKTLTLAYDSDASVYKVTDCSEKATKAIIPSVYDDGTNGSHPVTVVDNRAFSIVETLTSVTIPSGITTINNDAFFGSGITSISIPATVTSIGNTAFNYCIALETINVDEGNKVYSASENCIIDAAAKSVLSGCKNSVIPADSSVTSIGNSAFRGISTLTSIAIPSNISFIDTDAFNDAGLTSLNLPSSVKKIGTLTFNGCPFETIVVDSGNTIFKSTDNCLINIADKTLVYGSTSSIIPSDGSVITLGEGCFGDSAITSISIPAAITTVEDRAFCMSSLTSVIVPSTVSKLGSMVFAHCKQLESVVLPNGLTEISFGLFFNCEKLKSLTIPSGVTTIKASAFCFCSSLDYLIIPSAVTTIQESSFIFQYPSLSVYCEQTSQPEGYVSGWNDDVKTYWYSETENTDGSHWHYDASDNPVVWQAA